MNDVTKLTYAENHINGAGNARPHPDGKPWDKCCSSEDDTDYFCQCFMKKPRKGTSRYERDVNGRKYGRGIWPLVERLENEGGRFFCIHRKTDDGYHRECAGWFAKVRSKFKG